MFIETNLQFSDGLLKGSGTTNIFFDMLKCIYLRFQKCRFLSNLLISILKKSQQKGPAKSSLGLHISILNFPCGLRAIAPDVTTSNRKFTLCLLLEYLANLSRNYFYFIKLLQNYLRNRHRVHLHPPHLIKRSAQSDQIR